MPRRELELTSDWAPRQPQSLTAAGVDLSPAARKRNPHVITKARRAAVGWMERAWYFFDAVTEFHFAATWTGNTCSRAKLYVTHNGERVTSGPGFDAINAFFGGPEGQIEFLRQMGIHLTVSGDAWTAGFDPGGDEPDIWRVVAANELQRGDGLMIDADDTLRPLDAPFLMRTWRPHPRRYVEADCPTRSALPILQQLDQLMQLASAEIDSRLAGAGIMIIPSEVTLPGVVGDVNSTTFAEKLAEYMGTARDDLDTAEALVPFIMQVAGDQVEHVKHMLFYEDLSQELRERIEGLVRRLATGLDMPSEVLLGIADTNHWNAWAVDESSIKAYIEPLLSLVTTSVTTGYLRPLLKRLGIADPQAWTVQADTQEIRLRPNRSKEAIELYNLGQLSAAAMLRENGFEVDDAMQDDERIQWLAQKVASGSTTPELVEAALNYLQVPVVTPEPVDKPVETQEARPTPSIREHPVREIPEQSDDPAAIAAAAAAEQMVFRALERVGNRMRTRHGSFPPGVTAADFYLHAAPRSEAEVGSMLADAWAGVERFDYGIPMGTFRRALGIYTTQIIAHRRPFDRRELRDFIVKLHAETQQKELTRV